MKPVKIAQIGTGHDHAYPTCYSLMKNSDVFELIGIAEPNPEKIRNLETVDLYRRLPHFTVEQLLEMDTLEAVTVENEEHFLPPLPRNLLKRRRDPSGQTRNGRNRELCTAGTDHEGT